MVISPPLRHRLAVSFFFYACGCIFAAWASRIPTIKEWFRFNEAQLGAILFMLPLGSLIALPFASWSIARFGSRLMTFLSTLFYAVLLLLLGFTADWISVPSLAIVLFCFGFWGDVLNIAVNIQALQVQQEHYAKPLMSSFHGMWSLGALTGAFTGGLFMKMQWALSSHFAVIMLLFCGGSLLGLLWLIPKDRPREAHQKMLAWPDKALWILGGICFCCALCEGAMADWSSLYYKQVLQDVKRISTTGYTSFTLLMATGRLLGDRVTAYLGYRGILIADSLLIAAGLSLAIFIPTPLSVIVGFGLVGLGVATIIPIVYTLAGRNTRLAPGTALAAVSTVGFSGFLIGPPVIGWVAHLTGLRWALLLVLLLGVMVGLQARRVRTATSH